MKQTLRIATLALAAVMLFASVGCLVKTGDTSSSGTTSSTSSTKAEPAKSPASADRDAIAITLGDITFTAGDIEDVYNSYIDLFTYYGMSAPTDDESIAEYVQMSVEALLSDAVYEWKAKELGLALSADELAEIDTNAHNAANEEYEDIILSYAEYYTDAGAVEKVSDLTAEQLEETLNYVNMDVQYYYDDETADIDVYVSDAYDRYYQMYLAEAYQTKLKDKVMAEVTEADVDAWYEKELESQQSVMDADPTYYRTYRDDIESGYSTTPILYVPEGLAIVQVIALSPDSEAPAELETLETALKDLEAEYGKLALNGADEEELEAVRTQYAEKKAELDALKGEHFGSVQEQAEALYARLEAGEDFTAVASSVQESFAAEQVIYLTDTDYNFEDDVRKAVAALEDGAYTAVINVGETYCIAKLVGRLTAGAVDRATLTDAIAAEALAEAQEDAWYNQTAAWETEALEAAVLNESAYAYVGH